MPPYRQMPPYARRPVDYGVPPLWSPPIYQGYVEYPEPEPDGEEFVAPTWFQLNAVGPMGHGVDYRRVVGPAARMGASMYAGNKDLTLLRGPVVSAEEAFAMVPAGRSGSRAVGADYPEDWTVYRGEDDDLDDDEGLDLDGDVDGSVAMGSLSYDDFGLDELEAVDAGLFDDFGGAADEVLLVALAIPTAGVGAYLAGPRATIRRNARQIEKRIEKLCATFAKEKQGKDTVFTDARQKALVRKLERDLEQYARALRNLDDRLDRRRKNDKATMLLATDVDKAKVELAKLTKMVKGAEKKICKSKKKGDKGDKGSKNTGSQMREDLILMDVLGVTQDDIDFIEAFGGDDDLYGEDAPPAAEGAPPPRRRPIQKTRAFFTEKVQPAIEKFRSKAERAKMRADMLERRSAAALRQADELAVRSQEQEDVAARLARLEAQQMQAPASPTGPKLSTGQMVGVAVGVAAVAAAATYFISKR